MEKVQITNDINKALLTYFKKQSFTSVAVLVDENTREHCYPNVKNSFPDHKLIEIKSGEEHKNLDTCQQIWESLTSWHFDRKALLINLGGGVIGDMGGFCAATYKRGISFINLPTTLLAQVDASTGGKLGIDFNGFKNHIGVFTDPQCVFIDTVFLQTLPEREVKSGFAEVIKHCLIADGEMFEKLVEQPFESLDLAKLVKHSIGIKSRIVKEDPKEQGWRKILNFGHTIGHAIETFYLENGKEKLLHGEAIAIGMICETYLSIRRAGLKEEDAKIIYQYLIEFYQPKEIADEYHEAIADLTLQDKKNEHEEINCSLLRQTGQCGFNIVVDKDDVESALHIYNCLI
ncbi:MAG: 3-dehydroquinate synthase [Cyclobacteriaceae bacterium]